MVRLGAPIRSHPIPRGPATVRDEMGSLAPAPAAAAECHGATGEIAAVGLVPAPPEAVFAFLADLQNHWLLAGRFIEVVRLDGPPGSHHGGRVRMRGPLGLHRTARTLVEAAHPPHLMVGTATVGRSTRGCVSWTLTARDGATSVRLAAAVDEAGAIDRALLAIGGAGGFDGVS
jgi:uncharacterized protein YndB with AHSA1/START domain